MLKYMCTKGCDRYINYFLQFQIIKWCFSGCHKSIIPNNC